MASTESIGVLGTVEPELNEVTVMNMPLGITVMALKGSVDFRMTLLGLISKNFRKHNRKGASWLFDLTRVTFLDSEGIKAVHRCISEAKSEGGCSAVVASKNSWSYKVLVEYKAAKIMGIELFTTIRDALNYIGKHN